MKALTTIILFLLSTGEIMSCKCINNVDSVRTSIVFADIALKGQVISKHIVEKSDTIFNINEDGDTITIQVKPDPNAYLEFIIVVDEYFKGDVQKDIIEVRGPVYSSCMANLDNDGTYFVFANLADDKTYHTEYCSGNKRFNFTDLEILKELKNK